MPHARSHARKKTPKRVLALPDLEHAKTAVLSSLTSRSGQRTYDHAIREFVAWYCSEPRLAFNRTVVLRYRIYLEQRQYAPATINLRLAAVRSLHDVGRARHRGEGGLIHPDRENRFYHGWESCTRHSVSCFIIEQSRKYSP